MQRKIRAILWMLAATFLMGLLILSIHVKMMNCEEFLLVTPTTSQSSVISTEALEKINGKLILLTYGIVSKENLQVLNSNYDGNLIKTNYTYPFIMHQEFLKGSFFTEQDQKQGKKLAVLNKTSAYEMFGSINICGMKMKMGQDEYTITGVLDDKIQEKNVYTPASCWEENTNSFLVGLERNVTREQIKNECKPVASEENGYSFVYFADLTVLVYGVFFIGLKLTAISVSIFLFTKSHYCLREKIRYCRGLFKKFYLGDIIRNYPGAILKILLVVAGMILMVTLILNLFFSFTSYILFCSDHIAVLQLNDSSAFGLITQNLKTSIYLSFFFITGFFIDICLLLTEGLHSLGDRNDGENTD